MATINDVCKVTGLSKATVSRVINGSEQVKPATRKLVTAAMKQLNYHPSSVAQALATKVSNTIGLILPEFQSNYFGNILYQAEQCVQKANKKLVVVNSKKHSEGEQDAVRALAFQRCDAILLYSRHLTSDELVALQAEVNIPLIALNRQLTSDKIISLGLEQTQLARIAMEHLLELGHRNIACITSPLNSETGRRRHQVYQDLLAPYHSDIPESWTAEGDNTIQTGYDSTVKLLHASTPFTAIFACNDDMALGALRALHDAQLKVPDDVAVIGIDNEPAAGYSIPSLSTVALPISELTDAAMQLAIKYSNKTEVPITHQTYLGKLIVRESSC
ncbi:LacI family DNA-binding transcriptional regulator [Vibrio palustris]|uniref:HTH-type transcriptional regulator AscG n=1 Tax=Vibrio palustris TaxID=1918946 RepID=A0A1R4B357_9VIBR|nr:LacI family DNA-binding transcriptional regulator [Vibrio palustris]SJL83347.1 HTH-type transcriptional regulator AscG [Vibrio palustris]